MKNYTKKIISGMRPTGRIHLGNYNGVLKNWVKLQNHYECFFFIADMHALTTHQNNNNINENTNTMILEWLASGINPKKCNIFIQSHIPETFELHLILSMITPISWLKRVPAYKESEVNNKQQTYGFLGYPILQGADILTFKADYVPIGEDQLPHIELIREIVRKFNNIYKNNKKILIEPNAILSEHPKILGTDGKKMSKSKNNTILISDDTDILKKKINKMQTDPLRITKNIKGNPNNCSVWYLHKIYSKKSEQFFIEESCRNANIGCVKCKIYIYEKIINDTSLIREKIKKYEQDKYIIKDIIKYNYKKTRIIAKNTLKEVKSIINIT